MSTEPNDIEYPEECPNCGFEPEDPNVLAAESGEEPAERAKSLREQLDNASFWIQETTTSDTGKMTMRTVCPACREAVAECSVNEEVASAVGINEDDVGREYDGQN